MRPENQHDSNKLIERYNQIIVPKLREKGVIINDLHNLVSTDVYRYISQDTIHLTDEGIKLCAEQVAMIIKNTANTLPFVSENKNTDYKTDNKSLGLPV